MLDIKEYRGVKRTIKDFPDYSIDINGNVYRKDNNHKMTPTKDGKIGLSKKTPDGTKRTFVAISVLVWKNFNDCTTGMERKISAFPDYNIDIYGNITNSKNGKVLSINNKGTISLYKEENGVKVAKRVSVSRIMWETYYGKIPDNYVVINKSSIKSDVFLNNLVIAPKGTETSISNKIFRKRVAKKDKNKKLIEVYSSLEEAAKMNDVSSSTMSRYCSRKVKNDLFDGKFYFSYATEDE